LLVEAQLGQSNVITRHGRAIAAIVPLACATDGNRQKSLLGPAGSGKGLWGKDSTKTLRRLREEWQR
jgi:antitoxin (DNA-binding transcriptional repressor) of toxin-antitoxin stability system